MNTPSTDQNMPLKINNIKAIETLEKIVRSVKRPRRIFIAATKQNVGKTTVSVGLIASLREHFGKVGFIKPVGQRYLLECGYKVDEDSLLINKIFDFEYDLRDMSPIAVDKGFTERYIDGKETSDNANKIREAFQRMASDKDLVIIEGTGHAGVGSVFDLSNAAVAKLLDSRVILVSPGGIGNPIDEVILNKSLFDSIGVKLAGVIVNKVLPEKYEKVEKYVRKGLARFDIPVFGVIPYVELLQRPTLGDFRDELDMNVICGEEHLDRQAKNVLVGAMEVREASHYLENDCLVITPGNRIDFINLLIKHHTGRFREPFTIAGIVLSGGSIPNKKVVNTLRSAGIPTLLSKSHTYEVASRMHNLTVKIKSRNKNKVKLAIDMIQKYIDLEMVIRSLA